MKNKTKTLILGLLVLLTLWQGINFIRFAADEISAMRTWIGKPAQWRSAAYTTSETFADYIAFANEVIPVDALVAIPSGDLAPWNFSFKAFQEYFLIPRDVISCSSLTCFHETVSDGGYALIEDTAFLIQNSPTGRYDEQLMPFNDNWSILQPEGSTQASGSALRSFSSIAQMAMEMGLPLLWLTAAAVPGLLLVSAVLPRWRWLARFFMGLTLGLGMVSFLLYLILLVSNTISNGLIITATLLWWGISAVVWYLVSRGTKLEIVGILPDIKFSLLEIIILICGSLVGIIAVGKGYWATDGIVLWAAKGYGISAFGLSEGISNWGTLSARYPLELPMLIAVFKTMFGDLVPQSKILPVVFYIALPLAAAEYFRTRFSWKEYIWIVLLWIFSPQILQHGTIGYANYPFTFYLISGVMIILLAFKDQEKKIHHKPLLVLGGSLLALGAWTRPEGGILTLVVLLLIVFWQKNLKENWVLFAPLALYTAIWTLTEKIVYTKVPFTDGFLSDGLRNVFQGNIIWGDAGYVIKSFFNTTLDFAEWGVLGWIILLSLLAVLIWRRATPETSLLLIAGILLTLAGSAIIYLRVYNPAGCDVSCMVNTAMERLILPGVGLLWIGGSSYLLELFEHSRSNTQ